MAVSSPGPLAAPRRRQAAFALFCVAAFGLQLWLAAPRRLVRHALWSLHALWVRGVGAAGLAAAAPCLARFRRQPRSTAFWVATATVGAAVALRLLLLALIHASAFTTNISRYLYPVIPLYSCLMLLLVDAALAGRRLSRTPH